MIDGIFLLMDSFAPAAAAGFVVMTMSAVTAVAVSSFGPRKRDDRYF